MQIITRIFEVIKRGFINFLSWLLDILGGSSYENRYNEFQKDEYQKYSTSSSRNYDNEIQSLKSNINSLRQDLSRIADELAATTEECRELHKRLNSITDEYLHDMDNMKDEICKRFEHEISARFSNPIHEDTAEDTDIHQQYSKVFCEASSDGKYLINITLSSNLRSSFIELDEDTGCFSIVNTKDCIEYILANRDYALGCCIVNVSSPSPSSVKVEEQGIAEKEDNSEYWKVTKKMKITLY